MNDAIDCVKSEERTEQNHGWCSTIMLEGRGKRLVTMRLCNIVDASTKSVNSCKSQNERKCGEVKWEKCIRVEMLQELKKEITEAKATDAMVVGDLKEDTHAQNTQKFIANRDCTMYLVKFMMLKWKIEM